MSNWDYNVTEKERDIFWIEYYSKFGIEYIPNKELYITRMTCEYEYLDRIFATKAVQYLLSEFETTSKNTVSFSKACNYWINKCGMENIKCSFDDIKEAYTLAYGYGCEFEFEKL